ncbi:hypothetical protein TRFO_14365 [Tritrichomonas foetus]|uniref:DUF4201 domain-containing protein n=1 Tax=Tritrichomonas foetus TaxID=1144522 RepID=A0A1J4L003_9EUKA|nr:hypothetical protein TRFO_14365 [Tritrichomonas foetus]|eukprot:OHT15181.1 hypothetical protein TRFO_14365 [Tritrichomonas foetus]
MSRLDVKDLNSSNFSKSSASSVSNTYAQLEGFLNDLENKERDLQDKHQELVEEFLKTRSSIVNMSSVSQKIEYQSKKLSRSILGQSFSENDENNDAVKLQKNQNSVDIKILKSDQEILELDSRIIQAHIEKLKFHRKISKIQQKKDEIKKQCSFQKKEIKNTISQLRSNKIALNELAASIQYDKLQYSDEIRQKSLKLQKLCQLLRETEDKKTQFITRKRESPQMNGKTTKNESLPMNYINDKENKPKVKKILTKLDKIKSRKRNFKEQTKFINNETNELLQKEKVINKKIKKINKEISKQDTFSTKIEKKINKYSKRAQKKNINHSFYNPYNNYFPTIEELKDNLQQLLHQIEMAKNVNDNLINESIIADNSPYQYNQGYERKYDNIEDELVQTNYDISCLKNDIEIQKRNIIEAKMEYSNLEQISADLLRIAVNREKRIILKTQKRNDDHEQFILDTLVKIQQMKGRIAVRKANIERTSCHNKFTQNILNHVSNCCSTKDFQGRLAFIPDHYIYLAK